MENTNIALAARTRLRLSKYGMLQLRMLDMYALKRVKVSNKILANNKKFQRGHPHAYESLLRANNEHEKAD